MPSGMSADQHKVRENRLRRVAERQGMMLQKSRRRDPRSLDYASFWLTEPETNIVVTGGQFYWALTPAHAIATPTRGSAALDGPAVDFRTNPQSCAAAARRAVGAGGLEVPAVRQVLNFCHNRSRFFRGRAPRQNGFRI